MFEYEGQAVIKIVYKAVSKTFIKKSSLNSGTPYPYVMNPLEVGDSRLIPCHFDLFHLIFPVLVPV